MSDFDNGCELIYNNEIGAYFVKKRDGSLLQLKDTITGGNLKLGENGEFISEYLPNGSNKFFYDNKRECVIPKFIPDTLSPAHFVVLDGVDYMALDSDSSIRYEIDNYGRILTDDEIKFLNENRKTQEIIAKRYENEIRKIRDDSEREIREIHSNNELNTWIIDHDLTSFFDDVNLDIRDYLEKTLDIYRNSSSPLMSSFLVKGSKCYYCTCVIGGDNVCARGVDYDD